MEKLEKRTYNQIAETYKEKTEKLLEDEIIRDVKILFESEKGDSEIESALIETLLHLNLLVIEIKNIIA